LEFARADRQRRCRSDHRIAASAVVAAKIFHPPKIFHLPVFHVPMTFLP
jgi:hypothetical protein